ERRQGSSDGFAWVCGRRLAAILDADRTLARPGCERRIWRGGNALRPGAQISGGVTQSALAIYLRRCAACGRSDLRRDPSPPSASQHIGKSPTLCRATIRADQTRHLSYLSTHVRNAVAGIRL